MKLRINERNQLARFLNVAEKNKILKSMVSLI